MNGKKQVSKTGQSKSRTAYWQQEWMVKVLSNGYCSFAKLLFMRIASFGERGCWMTNETLSEEFNRSERTIRRAVSSLWASGELIVTGWNGHGRKMYAARNHRVTEELNRACSEAISRGKIKDVSEYRAKIRFRPKPEEQQN